MTANQPLLPLNDMLSLVAQRGLARVEFEVVRAVALALWYGVETPELAGLQGPHVAEAVQLVERLSYYNVVPQPRKKVLLGKVRKALEFLQSVTRTDFERAYKAFLPELQPLQTRHYVRTWA